MRVKGLDFRMGTVTLLVVRTFMATPPVSVSTATCIGIVAKARQDNSRPDLDKRERKRESGSWFESLGVNPRSFCRGVSHLIIIKNKIPGSVGN